MVEYWCIGAAQLEMHYHTGIKEKPYYARRKKILNKMSINSHKEAVVIAAPYGLGRPKTYVQ